MFVQSNDGVLRGEAAGSANAVVGLMSAKGSDGCLRISSRDGRVGDVGLVVESSLVDLSDK